MFRLRVIGTYFYDHEDQKTTESFANVLIKIDSTTGKW